MQNDLENTGNVHGDVCLRKQRRKRQKLIITELFLDYAKNSTLHGLRYIAQKGLTTVEKVFWMVTFTISVILCSYFIKNVYVKWKTCPVIVTVSERLVSVGEVPFPSVTICPQIKSRATIYNISKEVDYLLNRTLNNGSDEDLAKIADVAMICEYEYYDFKRNFANVNLTKHIDEVAPTVDVLADCHWQNDNIPCDVLFNKVYTAEGLCFNMNGLAANDIILDTVQSDYKYLERDQSIKGWSLENGYSDTEEDPYPKRGNENGATPDLEVILHFNEEDTDALCNGLNSGYKIYLQHPADFPQSSMYYYAAIDRQVSSLAISFHVLSTADELGEYEAEIRQCYFPKDRQLRYFKIYTANNCRAECLSNYTFQECDCVGYYMPYDNSSKICAENKMECMDDARNKMAYRELRFEIAKKREGCRCLPACNSVEYDAEILKTEFHLKRVIKKLYGWNDDSINTSKFSKIEMYFKKPQFVSMRRSELFGKTDFLANIGGLLGVFLGFSFLSLIEILYFITLRVCYSLKRDLKEEKRTTTHTKVK